MHVTIDTSRCDIYHLLVVIAITYCSKGLALTISSYVHNYATMPIQFIITLLMNGRQAAVMTFLSRAAS